MGVFEMVVIVVFLGTVGKVAQAMLGRAPHGDAAGTADHLRRLEAELRSNELRLAQAEEKVAELGEKLHFVEDLLAKPRRAAELPPPAE